MRRAGWSGVQLGAVLLLLVGLVGAWPVTGVTAPGMVTGTGGGLAERPGDVDHLYRIVGRVRVLVFWVSADDVGGARITWRGGGRHQIVSLLIGSDPQRAPREVNEWGYVRESVAGEFASIFGIRTVTDGDSPGEAEARRSHANGLAEFGVLCGTVTPVDATSRTAAVQVPREATYRDVGRVLDVLERSALWKRRHTSRPAGVAPGFLTALDQTMRSSAASAREAHTSPIFPRLAYVYRDAVYDLTPRRVDRVPQLRTRSGMFQNLLRTDFSIRNRATGSTAEFRVTYGTEGALAGVPVHAQFQPNWWFRVELELDERGDAPADPASELTIRQRIETLCGSPPER